MPETIYFDTCALNRLTDNQSQQRIKEEAEAVSRILDRVTDGSLRWYRSGALLAELSANPNTSTRSVALAFLALTSDSILRTTAVEARAGWLQQVGFGGYDSFHLALAESETLDWLFTVDDRFLKKAAAERPLDARPVVVNPLEWVRRRSLWLLKQ